MRDSFLSVRFYQPRSRRILVCSFRCYNDDSPCLFHRTVGIPFHPRSSSPLLRLCDYSVQALGGHTYEFASLKRGLLSVLFHRLIDHQKPSHRLCFRGNTVTLWEKPRFGHFKQCGSFVISRDYAPSPSFRAPPVRNASTLLLMDDHRIVYSVTKLNHHLALYYYDELSFILALFATQCLVYEGFLLFSLVCGNKAALNEKTFIVDTFADHRGYPEGDRLLIQRLQINQSPTHPQRSTSDSLCRASACAPHPTHHIRLRKPLGGNDRARPRTPFRIMTASTSLESPFPAAPWSGDDWRNDLP